MKNCKTKVKLSGYRSKVSKKVLKGDLKDEIRPGKASQAGLCELSDH